MEQFSAYFGIKNHPEMSQDGLRKQPKRAKMTKRWSFQNKRFVLFFTVDLEHRTFEESPKRGQTTPATTPKNLQGAIQKRVHRRTPNFAKNDPEVVAKIPRKTVSNGAKKWTRKWMSSGRSQRASGRSGRGAGTYG